MKRIFFSFVLLSAVIYLKAQINQIEYFFDIDPGFGNGLNPGTPEIIESNQGKTYELLNFTAPVSGLLDGCHTLYLRAKNAAGWSQTQSRPFIKVSLPGDKNLQIKSVEYFFDSDPGFGNGIIISSPPNGDTYNLNADIRSLSPGLHTFFVRAINNENRWSHIMSRPFVKTILPTDMASEFTVLEYFIDTDPGIDNGIAIPVPVNNNTIDFTVDLANIPFGSHSLFIRGKNRNGVWKEIGIHTFSIISSGINDPENQEIIVYPNPVSEILFIRNEFQIIKQISLFDFNGNILEKNNQSINLPLIQLSIDNYPSGTYILKIEMGNSNKTIKIIKK